MKRQVYLYRGDTQSRGVCKESVWHVKKQLQRDYQERFLIEEIGDDKMYPKRWDNQSILVLPGGECSLWDEKINEKKLGEIRSFVERGGKVLGICAGAYFCSHKVHYRQDCLCDIHRERDLAFFRGLAQGPILENNHPYSNEWNLEAVKVRWEEDQSEGYLLMSGGGCFVPHSGIPKNDYQVLARYVDQPTKSSIAMICCRSKKGIVVLSGPHFEFSGLDVSSNYLSSLDDKKRKSLFLLQESEHFRLMCQKKIFKMLSTV